MLFTAVQLFGADASYGPNQVALLIATAAAAAVGMSRGKEWSEIQQGMVAGIGIGLLPTLIMIAVGALIGSWMISGTVPAMVYYGIALLNPGFFFVTAALICALASISIGSSWSVAGTLGIGLIGIAESYNLSPAIAAGAIISGAYFGDKLSPLSDTTNLAAACTAVDLFAHIRNMLWTTLPAFLICLMVFTFIEVNEAPPPQQIAELRQAIDQGFDTNIIVLTPVLVMLLLIWRRVPAYPAIVISACAGLVIALLFQSDVVREMALRSYPDSTLPLLQGIWMTLFNGFEGSTGNMQLDKLISKGGMASMLNTVWLIISALAFGGVLECTGILKEILEGVLKLVKNSGDLILATVSGGMITNVLAADQFLAIALPGRLFAPYYEERGLSRLTLSRTLEDSATMTSALIPWNTCGAYMAATLGVATWNYAPYAIFNFTCPMLAVIFGYLMIQQKSIVSLTE